MGAAPSTALQVLKEGVKSEEDFLHLGVMLNKTPESDYNKNWFYVDKKGEKVGPVGSSVILGPLFLSKEITSETLVWKAKLVDNWSPLKEVCNRLAPQIKKKASGRLSAEAKALREAEKVEAPIVNIVTEENESNKNINKESNDNVKKNSHVLIYTVLGDYYCKQSKSLLISVGIKFTEINIDEFPERYEEMFRLTKEKSTPQIILNGLHIGGFEALRDVIKNKKFDELIAETLHHRSVGKFNLAPLSLNSSLLAINNQDSLGSNISLDSNISAAINFRIAEMEDKSTSRSSSVLSTKMLDEIDKKAINSVTLEDSLLNCYLYDILNFIKNPLNDLTCKNRSFKSKTYNSFIASDCIECLSSFIKCNRDSSIFLLQGLINLNEIEVISGDFLSSKDFKNIYLRFTSPRYEILNKSKKTPALKSTRLPQDVSISAVYIVKSILEENPPNSKTGQLDIDAIKQSPFYETFLELVNEITLVDVHTLKHEDAVAFFLNLYTCLLFHSCIEFGVPDTIIKRMKLANECAYIVGKNGLCLSLNDIAHGILLGNKKPPKSFFARFGEQDERRFYALKKYDNRLIFVLSSILHTTVAIFRPAMVSSQVEGIIRDYFNDSRVLNVDLVKGELRLPCEIDLYCNQLGSNESEAVSWCLKFLTARNVGKLSRLQESKDWCIIYLPELNLFQQKDHGDEVSDNFSSDHPKVARSSIVPASLPLPSAGRKVSTSPGKIQIGPPPPPPTYSPPPSPPPGMPLKGPKEYIAINELVPITTNKMSKVPLLKDSTSEATYSLLKPKGATKSPSQIMNPVKLSEINSGKMDALETLNNMMDKKVYNNNNSNPSMTNVNSSSSGLTPPKSTNPATRAPRSPSTNTNTSVISPPSDGLSSNRNLSNRTDTSRSPSTNNNLNNSLFIPAGPPPPPPLEEDHYVPHWMVPPPPPPIDEYVPPPPPMEK